MDTYFKESEGRVSELEIKGYLTAAMYSPLKKERNEEFASPLHSEEGHWKFQRGGGLRNQNC